MSVNKTLSSWKATINKSKYIKISSTVKSKVHEKSLSLFEIIHNKSEIRKEKQKNPLNSF